MLPRKQLHLSDLDLSEPVASKQFSHSQAAVLRLNLRRVRLSSNRQFRLVFGFHPR